MKLHVLGVGTPDPSANRFGSGFVLEVGDERIMIDCGPASVYKLARLGIEPTQVNHLLFTHQHSDHNVDYPCFLLTRWDMDNGDRERIKPVHVYGPPPTTSFTERLIGQHGAFHEDLTARIESEVSQLMHTNRGGALPRWRPQVDVRDIEPGLVVQHDTWQATAIEVYHMQPWLREYGYRIQTDQGLVAFTGDAGPCEALDELARGADVLVMASAHMNESAPLTMRTVTGPRDVAKVASRAGVKTVVLTHMPEGRARPGNREAMVTEVAKGFDGKIILPDEVTSLTLA